MKKFSEGETTINFKFRFWKSFPSWRYAHYSIFKFENSPIKYYTLLIVLASFHFHLEISYQGCKDR